MRTVDTKARMIETMCAIGEVCLRAFLVMIYFNVGCM